MSLLNRGLCFLALSVNIISRLALSRNVRGFFIWVTIKQLQNNCKIICVNTCTIQKGIIHLPYQTTRNMITKEGKKILKGIIAEEGIKLGELAKKNGLRPEDISRVLNGETKRQLKAQQVLIREIKKHRPDLIIEELTN